jgi:hypothetical protein
MTTQRSADPNGEHEVEGHTIVKFPASEEPGPGETDEPEVEGHFIKDPEVEGHGVTPPPTAMQREEPEVEGHGVRYAITDDDSSEGVRARDQD